ncbi:hypothetical protein L1987_42521 [Smallanthus sonchifolius]|uniref:Uncharacterized protein n=1 Tax=Smallanthus sonchifolius TaxID=185202 RepID=A0ACB9GJ36_9ASTR|nr:hypothetical protein L1987_42521 [Smallanthus sonchifolius]
MAPLQRSKSESQTDELQIQHFIHPHVLHKIYMTSEFNCDGCNTGGYGVRYRCSACDFDIHEQCASSSYRISSHLHPHHQLILVNRPGNSHSCHVCKGVTNGLSYTCEIQACEFNVHTLCIQIPVATGVKSLSLDPSQLPGGVSTTPFGGYNGMQGTPATAFGGYNGVINSQPVMVNHQQHQMQRTHTMPLSGYNGGNTSQPVMINHQQQPVIATTSFSGYHGVNNNQTHMINHHQQPQPQQVMPMTGFGGQPVMVNHHRPQQQGMPATGFGGYPGGMNTLNNQPVTVNHHQQQQLMPTTAFNTNQQMMPNHHQQFQQQQGVMIPPTAVGGYNVVNNNNNQTVMIHQPPPPPPQQQSNGYAKVGKLAANILSTSIIGIPLFNSRN